MGEQVLVTGGGGFIGKALVSQLLARGDSVRTFSRGRYDDLVAMGVEHMQGDLAVAADVDRAVAGCATVYHVAAKPGIWGPYREYHRANVTGTENVLTACRRGGVARLVYCSTPTVIFGDGRSHEDLVDESAPYPARYLSHYGTTKAIAERAVLAANGTPTGASGSGDGTGNGDGSDGGNDEGDVDAGPRLATVALRPHLVWGPDDPNLFPRIVDRAKQGRLRIIGDGENRVSFTYVDNAAHAHIRAADALREAGPASPAAGRAYFIGEPEPVKIWPWLNEILAAVGIATIDKRVSLGTARRAGGVLEAVYKLLRLPGEPPMTRFVATQLAGSHAFTIAAAERDLGYAPIVDASTEGRERLIDWLKAREAAAGGADG